MCTRSELAFLGGSTEQVRVRVMKSQSLVHSHLTTENIPLACSQVIRWLFFLRCLDNNRKRRKKEPRKKLLDVLQVTECLLQSNSLFLQVPKVLVLQFLFFFPSLFNLSPPYMFAAMPFLRILETASFVL